MRKNAKFENAAVVGLNKVGITQKTMAALYGCHQTAISARMSKLGIRTTNASEVLEDIFFNLDPMEKEWYIQQLTTKSLSTFLQELIHKEFLNAKL